MVKIRQEKINDHEQVYNVIKTAFEHAEHSDGNEQDLVAALRKSRSFIPELSLTAVIDKKIVGYILFTEIRIGDAAELALAPLAVLPEYQRMGIGSALVAEGHKIAARLNYGYSVVLGSSKYYPKFGYVPANRYNIKSPFDVDDEYYMAIKLRENAKEVNGTVKYDPSFGI